MNARFRVLPWEVPSRSWSKLGAAGALCHVFDGYEENWDGGTWRAANDMSSSLIHAGQHAPGEENQLMPIFNFVGSGIVLRPGASPIMCGKAGDSGGKCGSFCPRVSPREAVTSELIGGLGQGGDGCGRSWRPEDFGGYLRRQAAYQIATKRLWHNEVVVKREAWNAALPKLVNAFFFSKNAHEDPWSWSQRARDAHARFLEAYRGSVSAEDVPLVELDLSDWERPFRAVT